MHDNFAETIFTQVMIINYKNVQRWNAINLNALFKEIFCLILWSFCNCVLMISFVRLYHNSDNYKVSLLSNSNNLCYTSDLLFKILCIVQIIYVCCFILKFRFLFGSKETEYDETEIHYVMGFERVNRRVYSNIQTH